MSATFEFDKTNASLTVGRYSGGRIGDKWIGYRYNITDVYGKPATDLTAGDLARLARWIVKELAKPHKDK